VSGPHGVTRKQKGTEMLKPGSRWKSKVCSAEVVIVRPATGDALPQCGGEDMIPLSESAETVPIKPGFEGGCSVGKRYKSATNGLEVLCTKAGAGALGTMGAALTVIEAKKLPASD
jgi:hypothetical protein